MDTVSDIGDLEDANGKQGSFPLGISEELVDSSEISRDDDINQDNGDKFLQKGECQNFQI